MEAQAQVDRLTLSRPTHRWSFTYYQQAAESSLEKSLTRDEALKNAILATEFYMKASKLASSDQERKRLRTKCQQLLLKAEEIKQSVDWTPGKNKELLLKAPSSERTITKREEAILLESSKLHGFVFPPWTSDPDDATFEETVVGSPSFTYDSYQVLPGWLVFKLLISTVIPQI